jgi:hypothetical protein
MHKWKWRLAPLLALAALGLSGASARADLFIPVSGADTIITSASDDGVFGPFALPFAFSFFGTAQTNVFVNNNGNLTFGVGDSTFTNVPFPQGGAPPRVAPFWDDLFEPPGTLRMSPAATGVFNIIWNGVGFFSGAGTTTAEATLLGAGNSFGAAPGTIVLSYGSVTGTNDGSVTVGLNAGNGTAFAVVPGGGSNGIFNQAQAIALSGTIWTFTPNGAGGYTVAAGPPGPVGPVIPEPASIVLLGSSVLGMFGYGLRRRKQAV